MKAGCLQGKEKETFPRSVLSNQNLTVLLLNTAHTSLAD